MNYCGPNVYTFSPPLAFLTLVGDTLTGATLNSGDISSTLVTVTVSLQDYPAIVITKTLTVNVVSNCVLTGALFNASSYTLNLGIDIQPYKIPFTQNCGTNPVLESNGASFVKIVNLSQTEGNLVVSGASNADIKTYSFTLTSTFEGQIKTKTIQLII